VDSAKIAQKCIEHDITDAAGLDGYENVSTPIGPKPGTDAADAFSSLIDRLGLPKRFADVDVGESETTMGHMFTRTNPRPISRAENVMTTRSAA
jgi:hypothetical protein